MSIRGERAAAQWSQWRSEGVPTVITLNEAWLLTQGRYGKQHDHSTPVSLATVAKAVTA